MANLFVIDGEDPFKALYHSWTTTRGLNFDLITFAFILYAVIAAKTLIGMVAPDFVKLASDNILITIFITTCSELALSFVELVFARLYVLLLEDVKSEG